MKALEASRQVGPPSVSSERAGLECARHNGHAHLLHGCIDDAAGD